MLAQAVEQSGEPVNRDSMLRVANQLRAQHGPAVFAQRICEQATKCGRKIIIDSVRTTAEAKCIQGAGGLLAAIDAPKELRFERVKSRGSCTDLIDWEEFCRNEDREMMNKDQTQPSLREVMNLADVSLTNEGCLQDLHRALKRHFPPRSICIVGPHGTGKTYLLRQLCKGLEHAGRDFFVCQELARGLIKEMNLTQKDFIDFNDRVVSFQFELLKLYMRHHDDAPANMHLISDRSVLDQLAYLKWKVSEGLVAKKKLQEAWKLASIESMKKLYVNTKFILMTPNPELCVNDGTRMLSDEKGLWELFQAFKWVLKEASIDFDQFTAKKDDAQDLIDFLLG